VAALLLAPRLSTLLAGASVMAAFGAVNAFGRLLAGRERSRGPGFAALFIAAMLAAAAALLSSHPALLVAIYAIAGVTGGAAIVGWRGRYPRKILFEIAAIGGCAGIGAGIAVAGGAEVPHAAVVAAVITTWGIWSVWWVRGQLARVLPKRTPWSSGRPVVIALSLTLFAFGTLLGHSLAAALPLLYPLRTVVHAPIRSPGNARRLGLTELAWSLGVAGLAVVL
jgi:hypothetical protein